MMGPRARRFALGAVSLLATVLLSAPALGQPSFNGIGDLPGGPYQSFAEAISADGSTVVGQGRDADGSQAWRWTPSGGLEGLGHMSPLATGIAYGVSADGSVIAGNGFSSNGDEAFRWTEATGMQGIGSLPSASFDSTARDISEDGTTIVGTSVDPDSRFHAMRWTQAEGMIPLGTLLPLGGNSYAHDVSADGSVVVGRSHSPLGGFEAFRWTSAEGMTGLGDLAGGDVYSQANGITADGTTIVGFGRTATGSEAFRWTAETGLVGLGDLAGGGTGSNAFSVSASGEVIVGGAGTDAGNKAFIWDEQNGMQDLALVLTSLGVDVTGWQLEAATDISADGTVIVGHGRNPLGQQDAWIATIPEPGTGLLVMIGLAGLAGRRPSRSPRWSR